MKLAIMSDLHLDQHPDKGEAFINSLDPKGVDILVLAGDTAEIADIQKPMELFCAKYPKVIFVSGNHEYYGSDAGTVAHTFDLLKEEFDNLHILDNDVLEVDGRRFLGTTLWFPFVSPERTWNWSDFTYIAEFDKWVFKENKKSVDFLTQNIQEGDIVITHYLPSPLCISEKFAGNASNVFFLTNLHLLIEEKKPLLWIHGHTHTHVDIKIGKTRVLANPMGYIMYHETIEGNGFNDKLMVEV